jgi:hypothetical protein
MKKVTVMMMVAAVTACVFGGNVLAEEVTKEGTATCAKCDLGTAKDCTNVLQVEEGGETVTYLLAGKAGKKWHKTICKTSKDVKITGTVEEKDGEKTLVASKIEDN